MRKPDSPSCAMSTSCPSLRRLRRRPSAMARSSSMTRIRAISLCRRKKDAEGAAFAEAGVQLDLAAVCLDDFLGDGEAQAGALGLARKQVVAAVEALEDPLPILRADPGAVVLHLDGHGAAGFSGAQPDALLVARVLH